MNRSRFARRSLLRSEKTKGEIELDDIHALLRRQWHLIWTVCILLLADSVATFLLLFTNVLS